MFVLYLGTRACRTWVAFWSGKVTAPGVTSVSATNAVPEGTKKGLVGMRAAVGTSKPTAQTVEHTQFHPESSQVDNLNIRLQYHPKGTLKTMGLIERDLPALLDSDSDSDGDDGGAYTKARSCSGE